jgi:hypothetical protein
MQLSEFFGWAKTAIGFLLAPHVVAREVIADINTIALHKTGGNADTDALQAFAKQLLTETPPPFSIPTAARYGHTHIVAGSGHGKTQLLQQFILADLELVRKGARSIVVLDSQGDLINTILHLAELPEDRLVFINPKDLEYPPALNLFDFGLQRLGTYQAVDRQQLMYGAVALYEYLFGALLGAEMTQRQDLVFSFLAKLLMVVPNATIDTLLDFMRYPETTRPHIHKLDVRAQDFFTSEFYTSKYDTTRSQIVTRLWGVLKNDTLAQMFSSPENKLDLFNALNRGSVVLIYTAKGFLKDQSELFGRFFIALLAQAVQERAVLPPGERMSTFFYIDEAQDYFNGGNTVLQEMINQSRKQNVGLVLSHQNLNQLDTKLRATIMSSTAVKLVGGVSSDDADKFAKEMQCDAEFIRSMQKHARGSEFACFVRNHSEQALPLPVTFGQMERQPKKSEDVFNRMIAENRRRYAGGVAKPDSGTPSSSLTTHEPL